MSDIPSPPEAEAGKKLEPDAEAETSSTGRLLTIGDIHGKYSTLLGLLKGAGLIDYRCRWTGGNDHLVLLGDYVDRGEHGIEVLEALERLQGEAAAAGGRMTVLLGNHDAIMLAAAYGKDGSMPQEYHYLDIRDNHTGDPFDPERIPGNGGYEREVLALRDRPELLAWYAQQPMLHLEEDTLFGHGNIDYSRFGRSLEEINEGFAELLKTARGAFEAFALMSVRSWAAHGQEGVPDEHSLTPEEGLKRMLSTFGGSRYIHGHTPENGSILRPLVYGGGKGVNIDHAIAYGDFPGYILDVRTTEPILGGTGMDFLFSLPCDSDELTLERLASLHRSEGVPFRRVLLRDYLEEMRLEAVQDSPSLKKSDHDDLERALKEMLVIASLSSHPGMHEKARANLRLLEEIRARWKA